MSGEIRALIDRAAGGEEQAWWALVEQYKGLVWRMLRNFRSLGEEGREDLYQEVFATLVRGALKNFHGTTEHEFRAYLRVITKSRLNDYFRAKGRRPEFPDDDDELSDAKPDAASHDENQTTEEWATKREALRRSLDCIKELSFEDQQVFWMKFKDLTDSTITETLGLPVGTIASKYSRAKDKIRECLKRAGAFDDDAAPATGRELVEGK